MVNAPANSTKTFIFEDDFTSFIADTRDIRSAAIFYDEASHTWCAGVTVRENYSKLRFEDGDSARLFIRQLHAAKQDELDRLTTNAEARENAKKSA